MYRSSGISGARPVMENSLRQSYIDQAEATSYKMAIGARPQLFQHGCTIPFDLSMRRILLPRPVHPHQHSVPFCNLNQPHPRSLPLTLQLTSHDLDLRDTVRISQHNTDLTRRGSLLRELADLVDDLFGRDFQPRRPASNQRTKVSKDKIPKNICMLERVGLSVPPLT